MLDYSNASNVAMTWMEGSVAVSFVTKRIQDRASKYDTGNTKIINFAEYSS